MNKDDKTTRSKIPIKTGKVFEKLLIVSVMVNNTSHLAFSIIPIIPLNITGPFSLARVFGRSSESLAATRLVLSWRREAVARET